jgi:hypothetical protein
MVLHRTSCSLGDGRWRGSLTAAGSGEEVVPASDYRALRNQVRKLHRLLGKKTLEAEILKEALEHATGSKKQLRLVPSLAMRVWPFRVSPQTL